MEVTGNLQIDAEAAAGQLLVKAVAQLASANELKLAEIDLALGTVGLIMLASGIHRIADALESRAKATNEAAGTVTVGPPPAGT